MNTEIVPPLSAIAGHQLRNVSPSSTTTSGTVSSRFFIFYDQCNVIICFFLFHANSFSTVAAMTLHQPLSCLNIKRSKKLTPRPQKDRENLRPSRNRTCSLLRRIDQSDAPEDLFSSEILTGFSLPLRAGRAREIGRRTNRSLKVRFPKLMKKS